MRSIAHSLLAERQSLGAGARSIHHRRRELATLLRLPLALERAPALVPALAAGRAPRRVLRRENRRRAEAHLATRRMTVTESATKSLSTNRRGPVHERPSAMETV
jgi:hypothetical protein